MREELKDKTDIINPFHTIYLENVSGMLKINHAKVKINLHRQNMSDLKVSTHLHNISLNLSNKMAKNIASPQIDSTNIMVCYSKENVINF